MGNGPGGEQGLKGGEGWGRSENLWGKSVKGGDLLTAREGGEGEEKDSQVGNGWGKDGKRSEAWRLRLGRVRTGWETVRKTGTGGEGLEKGGGGW